MFGLAAAATALPQDSRAALAAPAPSAHDHEPRQGAGFYKFKVGAGASAVECYSIGDSQARIPSFPLWGENASEAEVGKVLDEAYIEAPPAPILVHFNVLMFKVGSEVWLVDSGNGPRTPDAGGDGMLLGTLASLGVLPSDVGGIIISHMHGDHIDGLLSRDGELAFPKAKFFLNKTERDFWKDNPDLSKTTLDAGWKQGMIANAQKVLALLEKSNRLEIVGDSDELTTGVRVRKTGGHTPGHQTVEIERAGRKFVMLADAVHHFVMSFRRPEWHVKFDYDAQVGATTRRKVLDQIASERTLVMCYHTPWPGVGRVRARDGAFDWLPASWEW
jgi:glyoxylase-like metal-dependent hydrolase (beta-lactamase superfamily II)